MSLLNLPIKAVTRNRVVDPLEIFKGLMLRTRHAVFRTCIESLESHLAIDLQTLQNAAEPDGE